MRLASCLTVLLLAAAPVHAACTVAVTPVDFGTYSPFLSAPRDSTGQVTVNCTESESYVVAMNAGVHAGGTFANRRLSNGETYLSYQLYTDATRTTVWGDGSGGSVTVARAGSMPIALYGRIAPRQSVSAGAFSDTILVTIAY